MKISNDRTELDGVLEDPANTILLIFTGPKALAIYGLANKSIGEGWRKTILIEDLSRLKTDEQTHWAPSPDSYVLLKRDRSVSMKGNLSDFCDPNGVPALIKIKRAFAKAD